MVPTGGSSTPDGPANTRLLLTLSLGGVVTMCLGLGWFVQEEANRNVNVDRSSLPYIGIGLG